MIDRSFAHLQSSKQTTMQATRTDTQSPSCKTLFILFGFQRGCQSIIPISGWLGDILQGVSERFQNWCQKKYISNLNYEPQLFPFTVISLENKTVTSTRWSHWSFLFFLPFTRNSIEHKQDRKRTDGQLWKFNPNVCVIFLWETQNAVSHRISHESPREVGQATR